MILLRNLDELTAANRSGALSIGNFDGVHLGHARIIDQLVKEARRVDGPAIVLTFDPHPAKLLRPELAPAALTNIERRAALLGELGVDLVVAYPSNQHLLSLSAKEFFASIVVEKLGAQAMVEGPNFYFGKNRSGDVERLQKLCEEEAIDLTIVPPFIHNDEIVSSSYIREAIAKGAVSEVATLLTQPYRIRGDVVKGEQRGATIGFPTANLDGIHTLLPAVGVYAGRAFAAGEKWKAAINIGPNPTFGEGSFKVEAHLLDFEGNLYNEPLEIEFVRRLRETRSFDSIEQLTEQLTKDVSEAREA